MVTFDRLLKNEVAITTINAKIYCRKKIVKEYEALIDQYTYDPNKSYPPDMINCFDVLFKNEEEIELLNKIKKTLVKANLRHIKVLADQNEILLLPEIRILYHAIDNLKGGIRYE